MKSYQRHSQFFRAGGFTLVELMIVVAIVGVLASIAIPAYTQYVRKSKIAEATAALAGMSVKMEQYFQDNRSYTDPGGNNALDACQQGTVAPLPNPQPPDFTLSCPTLTTSTYTIEADGNAGSMSQVKYSIDQAGNRVTVSLPGGWTYPNPNTCWARNEGGGC